MTGMAPLSQTLRQQVDAVSAGSTAQTVLGECAFAGVVSAAGFIPVSAITGANTNSRTVTVTNRGQSGSGTTVVATLALTSGVNAAADDVKNLTLSGTAANLVVAAGDVLSYESTTVGTGIADPGGQVFVTITRS